MLGVGGGETGPGVDVVCTPTVAPAWCFALDEIDRVADDVVDDDGREVVEAMRLNCGCRRGRYFKRDVSIVAEGANMPPRLERAGIKAIVLSRGPTLRSGRNEAISGLWLVYVVAAA